MKKYLYTFVIIISLFSCTQPDAGHEIKQHESTDSVAVFSDPKMNLNLHALMPVEIDSSDLMLFKLGFEKNESNRNDSYSSYSKYVQAKFWNIIFFNPLTGEKYLLSENRMLINSLQTEGGAGKIASLYKQHIIYNITTEDFNSDNKLDNKDPEYLFISDRSGKGFRQVSPAAMHLVSWEYVAGNKIIMEVKADSNKDKQFDEHDETIMYLAGINSNTVATPIFDTNFSNKIKLLYHNQWK